MYNNKSIDGRKVERCPFCNEIATVYNSQKLPVCKNHKNAVMNNMKCICGKLLELRTGKFGIYFNCITCGNFNLGKVLEVNELKDVSVLDDKKVSTFNSHFKERISKFNNSNFSGNKSANKTVDVSNSHFNKRVTKGNELFIDSNDTSYFD